MSNYGQATGNPVNPKFYQDPSNPRYGFGGGYHPGYENFEDYGYSGPQGMMGVHPTQHHVQENPGDEEAFALPAQPVKGGSKAASGTATKGKRKKQTSTKKVATTPKKSRSSKASLSKLAKTASSSSETLSSTNRSGQKQTGGRNADFSYPKGKKGSGISSSAALVTSESDIGALTDAERASWESGQREQIMNSSDGLPVNEAERKARASKDRNREHARNTRMRKKLYLENLKKSGENSSEQSCFS